MSEELTVDNDLYPVLSNNLSKLSKPEFKEWTNKID